VAELTAWAEDPAEDVAAEADDDEPEPAAP